MRNRSSSFLWGILIIIVGLGLAGNRLGIWYFSIFFSGWWTMFIIIPSLASLLQNGAKGSNVAGLVIGGWLFLSQQNIFPLYFMRDLAFPAILVIIGLSFIFRRSNQSHPKSIEDMQMNMEDGSQIYGDIPDLSAFFGSRKASFNNEVFTGATLNAIFGGVTLDLRDAIIQQNTVINASAIFGGIDIMVPPNVRVEVSGTPIFGGVSDKTSKFNHDADVIIYLNATCMFGGVDIK